MSTKKLHTTNVVWRTVWTAVPPLVGSKIPLSDAITSYPDNGGNRHSLLDSAMLS